MRKVAILAFISCLAACHHGIENNEAVRQGILDYLSGPIGLNLQAMDVKVESVKFDGNKAQAGVSISLKGNATALMTKTYDLEQNDGKWKVIPRADATGHGSAAMGGADPHGGVMPGPVAPGVENPHGSGGKMPLPSDLPPAGTKKE